MLQDAMHVAIHRAGHNTEQPVPLSAAVSPTTLMVSLSSHKFMVAGCPAGCAVTGSLCPSGAAASLSSQHSAPLQHVHPAAEIRQMVLDFVAARASTCAVRIAVWQPMSACLGKEPPQKLIRVGNHSGLMTFLLFTCLSHQPGMQQLVSTKQALTSRSHTNCRHCRSRSKLMCSPAAAIWAFRACMCKDSSFWKILFHDETPNPCITSMYATSVEKVQILHQRLYRCRELQVVRSVL